MTTRPHLLLLISLLVLPLGFCRANDVTFDFGGTNEGPSVFDLSGFYSLPLTIVEPNGAQINVSVGVNMVEDAAGNLHGFTNDVQELSLDENSSFAVTYTIAGKVTGNGQTAFANFVIHFTGFGGTAGQPQGNVEATISVNAEIDPNALTLNPIKPVLFMARMPQTSVRGFVPLDSEFSIPLPPGEDGSWSLTLQFDTFNRVIGTGFITTPSQALGLQLFGVFNSGEFAIKAIGVNDVGGTVSGVGSTATIFLPADVSTIDSLNGKIMGQRISF